MGVVRAVLIAIGLAAPVAAQTQPQPACDQRALIVARLAERYGEHPLGMGP